MINRKMANSRLTTVESKTHYVIVRGIETAIIGIISAAFVTLVTLAAGFFSLPSTVIQLQMDLASTKTSIGKVLDAINLHEEENTKEQTRILQQLSIANAAHAEQIAETLRRLEAHRVQIAALTQVQFDQGKSLLQLRAAEDKARNRSSK